MNGCCYLKSYCNLVKALDAIIAFKSNFYNIIYIIWYDMIQYNMIYIYDIVKVGFTNGNDLLDMQHMGIQLFMT